MKSTAQMDRLRRWQALQAKVTQKLMNKMQAAGVPQ
jgi:hypothetical protein